MLVLSLAAVNAGLAFWGYWLE